MCSLPPVFVAVLLSVPVLSQQATPRASQQLLQQTVLALSPAVAVSDLTMSGNAVRDTAPGQESGTVVFSAMSSGETRMDLSAPSGQHSEVYARGPRGLVGQWSGPDLKTHAVVEHNTWADPAWFSPLLILQRAAQSPSLAVSEITAAATTKSSPVIPEHLRIQHNPASPDNPSANRNLNGVTRNTMQAAWNTPKMDFYADPATHLPFELDFNTHPDNDFGRNIAVRVLYSDYRTVDGVKIPFHIQKLMNGNPMLDIQLESAKINAGLAASAFVVTAKAQQGEIR